MKIIFSPSKTMKYKKIDFKEKKEISFPEKTKLLIESLKSLSNSQIEKLFKIKNSLLEETFNNIQNYDKLDKFPALSLYEGVTFRQLELEKYSSQNLEYLNKNLFILSALYGVISPNTEIKPYRLDMTINFVNQNLYKFWKENINNFLEKFSDEIFINLASKEFSKLLDEKKFQIIDIEFRQKTENSLKNISTEGKKARGKFLNYMTLNSINSLDKLKEFSEDGYKFSPENSSEKVFYFIKDTL